MPQPSLHVEREWGREWKIAPHRCCSLEGLQLVAAAGAVKKFGFECGYGGTWVCTELMGFYMGHQIKIHIIFSFLFHFSPFKGNDVFFELCMLETH
ncbi:MADS3 [Zea mays]|jgi:hypothetical protein|uniref:MADS3 n=1 Tax=Zea mays TaxID=4577 RepID=A0A1D6HRI3_MAIZE|nr:MADS3 [Zea mays]ONM51097.1 MADS3 [Zea mays]